MWPVRKCAPSPRPARGEGWGEGLLPQIPKTTNAVSPPHPALRADLSRKRGEVLESLLHPRALLVLPVRDEIVDDGGIGQCRGIAEASRLVLGDLAQDAPHDLAGARLAQAWRELDLVGGRDRAYILAHPSHQFLAQFLARLGAAHQRDIGVDG